MGIVSNCFAAPHRDPLPIVSRRVYVRKVGEICSHQWTQIEGLVSSREAATACSLHRDGRRHPATPRRFCCRRIAAGSVQGCEFLGFHPRLYAATASRFRTRPMARGDSDCDWDAHRFASSQSRSSQISSTCRGGMESLPVRLLSCGLNFAVRLRRWPVFHSLFDALPCLCCKLY